MARDYRRTKSRLARTKSRKFLRQSMVLILLSLGVLFVVVQFGIPLLIKLAVFISDLRGKAPEEQVKEETILVPPTLQTVPEATFSATINIKGFGQPNLLLTLFLNGNPKQDIEVDDDGEFVYKNLKLKPGNNKIWAVLRDEEGNESSESREIKIIYDPSLPVITLDSPQDGSETSEDKIEVKGLIDEEASISINGHFVLQASDNSFSNMITLSEGENTITVVAKDMAGNQAEKQVKVNYSPN